MTIALCDTVFALREHGVAWRAEGKRIALVPTMGALHAGHLKLVEAARDWADRVIVTIFVNPKQFAPSEDFSAYPRSLEADCEQVAAAGADLVYAPAIAAMYPDGFTTTISLEGPATAGLEDRFRPTHFAGVATIVAKLLLQALTDVALFGEKDFQQLRVIERMARDLDLQTQILGVETVREADGLALSSRNVYLDGGERIRAPALHAALTAAARAIGAGGSVAASLAVAREAITASGFAIDYVEARNAQTLAPFADGHRGPGRILAAARLGRTRLIDNVPLDY
jgi:pantoate--beta-alanine ligase